MDPLYRSLHALRLRNFSRCADACKSIPPAQQKEKWYLICRARTLESWTDFTEPDDLSAADYVFDEHVLSELPRPGTSLRTAPSSRGSRPVSASGRALSGYAHPSNASGSSRGGTPMTSSSSRFTRLATASLVFSGDEPDVTSINASSFAQNPFLSRILVDYMLHRLRDPIRAVALAAECTSQHGFRDWWWKNRLGRSYYLLGLYADAEAQFRSSIATAPNADSRLELAKLYVRIDQPARATAELDAGAQQFPLDSRFALALARVWDQLGNDARARETWRGVLERDQASVEALASLGAATYYEDQPEAAELFYMYLRRLGIANAAVMNNLAITAMGGGDFANVGPAIVAALSLAVSPEEKADIWYNVSHIALVAGELGLADQALLIATSMSLKSAEAFNNLGLLELKKRNVQKSIAAFKAATDANPQMHEPWFNLGLVYQRVGQMQEALHAARQAVKLYPGFTDAVDLLEGIEQQLK